MKNIRLFILVLLLAPILTMTYCGGGSGGSDKVDLTDKPGGKPSLPGNNNPETTPGNSDENQITIDLSGTVLDESGNAVSGALITVKDSSGNVIFQITSAEDGSISFSSELSENTSPATVIISANGYTTETINVTSISDIQNAIAKITLDNADTTYYNFTTNVTDNTSGDSKPIASAAISIKDSNGVVIAQFPKTDSSGNASFAGFISDVAGSVTAYIDFEYLKNGEIKTYTYTVSADSLADLIAKMESGIAVLRNVVDGTPAETDDNTPPSTVQQ
nr:carboxypeptidase regulatory-like domain-containing protein [Spirochaetota bacterium]